MKYWKILFAGIVMILLFSCDKSVEHKVAYFITRPVSGFEVNYLDGTGQLKNEVIETQSAEDEWRYSYVAEEGDIVFVSARYTDPESALLVRILLDGKVYKESSSSGDTTRYITVSGTVPYE